jgi:hypothetical protein
MQKHEHLVYEQQQEIALRTCGQTAEKKTQRKEKVKPKLNPGVKIQKDYTTNCL